MYFDATPLNMTKLLVVALAIVAIVMLMRGRYASNMPLLFCIVGLWMQMISTAYRPTDSYILYVGLALALILRFEFMGKGFTKFIAFATGCAIGLEVLSTLDQVFANGTMFS